MAAESPKKAYRYNCNLIRPQMYSEKSLMESVVDFFADVVPQAYSGSSKLEDKEKIQWVRFENTDCSDIAKNPDLSKSDTKGLPLLLILGYSNGVQIWHITPNGEAQEILSIRQGPVRVLRLLPAPDPVFGHKDVYSSKRPLAVMVDSSSAGQPYCAAKFVSLKTGDEVHSISFKTLPIHTIECNKRFIVVIFLEKLCIYETCQFKQLVWITSCFPCPGSNVNPIALSTRWLAYGDKRLVPMHQSCGGMSGDGSQSYAATVISAAKGAFKGLSSLGEAMVSSVTGAKHQQIGKKLDTGVLDNGNRPGIVSVVDLQNIHGEHFNVNEDYEGEALIAHFHAHANEPVANMAFDSSGTLLVTACKLGHNFHIFRLMAHPCNSSLGAVHHLYTLHRGDTTAKVIDIVFNHDSRWVTVSTHRGTTHLFPITPYGGTVNVRTHCKPHIVNRASRFHKSAGLEEIEHSPVGRHSPVLSSSPGSSGQYDNRYPSLIQQNTLNNNMGNPRLPPYPHPITVYPAHQIKQPLNVYMTPGHKNNSPSHSPTRVDNIFFVCAKFSTPRLCVIGSPKLDIERKDASKRPVDSLYILAQSGTLVEYVLEPKAKVVGDKVTDDCLLDLGVAGRMQWNLQRLKNASEQRPPLPSNSPLILAHDAIVSQTPTAPDMFDMPGLTRQDSKDSLSSDHSWKDDQDEEWLSQVEIITHAGPHRRLWMGPQFSFKTYQNVQNTTVLSSNSSCLLSQSPEATMAAMDITGDDGDLESLKVQPARSNPVSMPTARPAYRRLSGSDSSPTPPGRGGQQAPLMIEAGSFDQSPKLCDVYSNWTESTVEKVPRGGEEMEEDQLKETLADAMAESPLKETAKISLRQEISRSDATLAEIKGAKQKSERKKDTSEGRKKKERNVKSSEGLNEFGANKTKESLNKEDEKCKKSVKSKNITKEETTSQKKSKSAKKKSSKEKIDSDVKTVANVSDESISKKSIHTKQATGDICESPVAIAKKSKSSDIEPKDPLVADSLDFLPVENVTVLRKTETLKTKSLSSMKKCEDNTLELENIESVLPDEPIIDIPVPNENILEEASGNTVDSSVHKAKSIKADKIVDDVSSGIDKSAEKNNMKSNPVVKKNSKKRKNKGGSASICAESIGDKSNNALLDDNHIEIKNNPSVLEITSLEQSVYLDAECHDSPTDCQKSDFESKMIVTGKDHCTTIVEIDIHKENVIRPGKHIKLVTVDGIGNSSTDTDNETIAHSNVIEEPAKSIENIAKTTEVSTIMSDKKLSKELVKHDCQENIELENLDIEDKLLDTQTASNNTIDNGASESFISKLDIGYIDSIQNVNEPAEQLDDQKPSFEPNNDKKTGLVESVDVDTGIPGNACRSESPVEACAKVDTAEMEGSMMSLSLQPGTDGLAMAESTTGSIKPGTDGLAMAESMMGSIKPGTDGLAMAESTMGSITPGTESTMGSIMPGTESTMGSIMPGTESTMGSIKPGTDGLAIAESTMGSIKPGTESTMGSIKPGTDGLAKAEPTKNEGLMVEVKSKKRRKKKRN